MQNNSKWPSTCRHDRLASCNPESTLRYRLLSSTSTITILNYNSWYSFYWSMQDRRLANRGTAVHSRLNTLNVSIALVPIHSYTEQDSWAIAKKTARCAQYMGALKSFESPHYAPDYFSRNLWWTFVPIDTKNVRTKFEVRSFTRSWDNRGCSKI